MSDSSLFSLNEIKASIERQDFDATPDEVVLALVEAVEAAMHVPLPEAQQNPWQNRLANALERFREW
jgi:lipoate-protein ligase A